MYLSDTQRRMCSRQGCRLLGQRTDHRRCEACGFVTQAYSADAAAHLIEQNVRVERHRSAVVAAPDLAAPNTLTFVLSGRTAMVLKSILRMFEAIGWFSALAGFAAPHRAWLGLPLLVVAATLSWVIETRILRVSVIATRDGLTVRNYWRTRQIAWAEITGFHITRNSGLSCELSHGKRVAMKGINQGLFGDPTPQTEAVARLESFRDASRASAISEA